MTSKRITFILLVCIRFLFTSPLTAQDFVHPGILHKEADFARMRQKVAEKAEPWYTTWNNLLASSEANLNWTPRATATVIRGGTGDNISLMYRDVAAAYQHALIYKISGDIAHGNKAVEILNAWSLINKTVSGNADRYLAAGLDGYQFANAAEMMRGYPGFDVKQFQNYLKNVFFKPLNERFIVGNVEYGDPNNGACCTNYRANWQTCNMAAMGAIAIFCDEADWYKEAINNFKSGCGTGNINKAVPFIHAGENGEPDLGQWEESGRDQGHTCGGFAEMGLFLELLYNQGDDYFSYADSRFRKAAEYISKFNILENGVGKYTLPYTTYSRQMGTNCSWYTESALSEAGRGARSSYLSQVYNHYAFRAKSSAAEVKYMKESLPTKYSGNMDGPHVSSDGGHPDTYDQPGFGNLTYTLDSASVILPWLNMDISARSIAKLPNYGETTLKDSTLTMIGSGAGIKDNSDQFQYAFQKLVDDGSIETQLTSVDEVNTLCQAGLMIRENTEQNSANVFLSLSAAQGIVLSSRDSIGKMTTTIATNASIHTFPYWLRLSRSGDAFIASISSDRVNWTAIGSKIIKMNRQVYAGLAVSGNNVNEICTAVFDKSILKQGNIKPILKVSTPLAGTTQYITPANISVSGTASDLDGLLDKAEIYVNDSLVYTAKASPFNYVLPGVTEGNYAVYIKAYDKTGGTTTSDTVTCTVNPVTTLLPWYKFDEPRGMFTYDSSGNNMTAYTQGVAVFTAGKINNALLLDGVDDYVKLPNTFINKLSDFSISTWVYQNQLVNWARIFDFGQSTSNYMMLTASNGSCMYFEIVSSTGAKQSVTTSRILPFGSWNYVTVTLANNVLTIYLNGAVIGKNTTFTLRPYDLGVSVTNNFIGKSQYTSDPNFSGKIDEFRFYNYALSVDEILTAMALTPIDEVKANPGLFYPNPATGEIYVVHAENSEVRIYDALGKLVLQQQITASNQSIDISRLTQGVYILKTMDKNFNQQQNRLIVK